MTNTKPVVQLPRFALLTQIEHCESWLAKRPTDAELELTLGTFCLRQKLWANARRHLEQALSDAIEPRAVRESHLSLATCTMRWISPNRPRHITRDVRWRPRYDNFLSRRAVDQGWRGRPSKLIKKH